jgi:hypothetical protein
MATLAKYWEHRWKSSASETLLRWINNSTPSKKYLHLIKNLDCRQASLLFQLHSGHIGLNHHLFIFVDQRLPPGHIATASQSNQSNIFYGTVCNIYRSSTSYVLSSSIILTHSLPSLIALLQVVLNPFLARTLKIEYTQTPE